MKAVHLPLTQALWMPLYEAGLLTGAYRDFSSVPRFYAGTPIGTDRSGALPTSLHKLLFPMPAYDARFAKPLEQVCLERAADILAENRGIKIYWSGGIDSTLVLLALANAGLKLGQATVVCNDASAAENPALFAELPGMGFVIDNRGAAPVNGVDADDTRLHVTGEFGNYVTSPMQEHVFRNNAEAPRKNAFAAPWRAVLIDQNPDYLAAPAKYVTTPGEAQAMEAFAAACPFSLETAHQYFWWVGFALRWQACGLRMGCARSPEQYQGFLDNTRHFFGGDEFQRWSMVYKRDNPVPPVEWVQLKQVFKDQIYKWWPNADYAATKAVEGSLGAAYEPFGRFEDYTVASTVDEMLAKLKG